MQTEQLNLKLQKDLYDEIELVSDILHIPKNEWARNILAYEVKKELEEHKRFIVIEYLKGKLSKNKLIAVLGKNEVKDMERIAKIGKKSFEDANKLVGLMR